jgi:hypothetical protein
MLKKYMIIAVVFYFYGCVSSNFTYIPPPEQPKIRTSIIVNAPKNVVWKKLITGIGAKFFMINNMDRESGFINISYSGNPQDFVEGGRSHYEVENLRGKREYDFPSNQESAQYEVFIDGNLCGIKRELKLEGKANIIVTEIDSVSTQVSVNVRYILSRTVSGWTATGVILTPDYKSISFDSNGSEAYPNAPQGSKYYSKGYFEKLILDIVL